MAKPTTRQIVYDAIVELYNQEQVVTRETLAEFIDLPLTTIDERLKLLVNDGDIIRIQRGVFKPKNQHGATRPISHTELPDGTVVIDVGDDVIKLTPREARTLGIMLAARAMQAGQIEAGHNAALAVGELSHKIKELERKVRKQAQRVTARSYQGAPKL